MFSTYYNFECLFQVKELPKPCTAPIEDEAYDATQGVDKMKIAWRYEGLNQVESSFGNNANFGHHFDLSKHIDHDIIENINVSYCYVNSSESNVNGKQTICNTITNMHFTK